VPDVGVHFDAQRFAATMKAAHVNSVTVFAKCHHGHLYYDTDRPERHPGLRRDLNLLGEQVRALHAAGIRAPIYISVQCDEYAANTHPEWIARNADSTIVGAGPFAAGWQILDMDSPYQEYLAEQTAEVLRQFDPVDGIFFDMCWDQPSCSNWAIDAMLRKNLDPRNAEHRRRHAHDLALGYMRRFYQQVKAASPEAGIYFNSRPLHNLAEEVPYLAQVEIEALPTGGWGYMYFPKNVRFARNFGREYLGMTARFHKSWADFGGLKPYAALEYETSQMMAHGAKCSVGDQMHPRGTLDAGAYDLIGKIYARVATREPWLVGAKSVAQIGLFQTHISETFKNVQGTDEGATRMLTQLKQQFDVVEAHSDWSRYALLILPDAVRVDEALAQRLADYVKGGGKIFASGTSGLSDDGTKVLLPLLGVAASGMSEFTTTYIRFGPEISEGVPDSEHVMYERGVRVAPVADKATSVATVVHPYFERDWDHFCSHFQTPGDQPSPYAAAVVTDASAYVSYPVFTAFVNHGNYPYRLLVQNLLNRLLPDPLLRVTGPTSLEATVMAQDGRSIVHLLQYVPERRTPTLDIVEDIVPLYDVPISLKLPKAPKAVYLAPEKQAVEFRYQNGRVDVTVPKVNGHAMVVFE
jgi:hypothetical protein